MVWVAVPFVVGAAIAVLLPSPSKTTATDPQSRAPVARLPVASWAPDPEVHAPPIQEEATSFRCDELEQELTRLDGQVQEWFGEAQPWPDVANDPLLGEEGFATWMEEIATDLPGLSVVEVDCSQYPCVGIWHTEKLPAALIEDPYVGDLLSPMIMLPINKGGETEYWVVASSFYENDTVDPAMVSLRMNAALSANGWYGEPVGPDDPEAAVPFPEVQ